jgi:hypothetical protein
VGEVVDPAGHVLVEAGRGREVRQGVELVGVAAVLGEDQVGPEGAKHLGTTASKQEIQDSSSV